MIAESAAHNILNSLKPEPCPASEEDPLKNALCPYYAQCLDLAIEKQWPQFTCQACGFKNSCMKIRPNAREIMGCYRLLSRIFVRRQDGVLFFH